MFMFSTFKHIVLSLFFVVLTTQLSHAAATITVEQSGVVIGNNMDGVAGIDLTINYDISMLSTPTVTKGGLVAKGMLAANTSMPGMIKIAVISMTPFSGSGQIASINFASNTANGGIKSISVSSMIDSKGAQVPVQASVGASASTPPSTPPATPAETPAKTPPATTQRPSTQGYTSTVTIQTDTLQTTTEPQILDKTSPMPRETMPQHQPEQNTAEPTTTVPASRMAVESRKEEPGQQVVFKSAADRFKTYRGDKSLPIMSALLGKEISKFISQEPTVALSDGKSRIRIVIDIPKRNANSPNFALDNATTLSVKKEAGENGRWIIEAMPEVNAWKATLSIIAGEDSFEYPLTVAPPLGSSIKADQAGWDMFLKEVGSPKKLRCDFNNDGLCDYIDEFIFVANHLAHK